jgi:Family of unknown function (DUF6491)
MKKILPIALTCGLLATSLQAKPAPHAWPELGVETDIVFPNDGAIRNFEANGNDGIWLEDRQRRWYYATLAGGCQDLNFAESIGFDTRGSSRFDKFSAIIVRGDTCPVVSVVTAEKPLPHKERQRLRNDVREAAKKSVAPAN